MGNPSEALFKCIATTLFFLFLMISYTSSSSSSSSHSSINQEIQPHQQDPIPAVHYHQVFYLKNTDPNMFRSRSHSQERVKKRKINRNKNMKQRKKKNKNKKMVKNNNMQYSRPFSVMLPKGFVPPSGSSPCHNDQPNSVSSFHCHLTSTTQPWWWGTKIVVTSSLYVYTDKLCLYTRHKQFTEKDRWGKCHCYMQLIIAFDPSCIAYCMISTFFSMTLLITVSFSFSYLILTCCNRGQRLTKL